NQGCTCNETFELPINACESFCLHHSFSSILSRPVRTTSQHNLETAERDYQREQQKIEAMRQKRNEIEQQRHILLHGNSRQRQALYQLPPTVASQEVAAAAAAATLPAANGASPVQWGRAEPNLKSKGIPQEKSESSVSQTTLKKNLSGE